MPLITWRFAVMNKSGKIIVGSVAIILLFVLVLHGQNGSQSRALEYMVIPPQAKNVTATLKSSNSKSNVSISTAKTTQYLLQPVRPEDWQYDLPSHGVSKEIQNSIWWQAAGFLELDFRKRPTDYNCKDVTNVGNWYGCFEGKFKLQKPCLVYSFGIANDFSFDDDMAELGCEVHSFDPSMGKADHVRKSGVHFHSIGLGGKTIEHFNPRHDLYVQEDQSWMIMTLGTIMSLLGHSDRNLDVLKIDIEGHEWTVIEYLLDQKFTSKIKQFLLEYHLFPDWPPRSDYTKFLRNYKRLHDLGFKKFFTALHPLNHTPKQFNIQADVGYINMGFQEV